VNEDLLRSLPGEYAALADHRRVMLEVADELAELHAAVTRLGDALEAEGLSGREWRSRDASLRAVARKLPDITVDQFVTRVAEFAAGKGPAYLRGDEGELERFHGEVGAIHTVASRLHEIAERRSHGPKPQRPLRAVERAFASARVAAALDGVVSILEDFRALEPFMAPLSSDEWNRAAQDHLGVDSPAVAERRGFSQTLPMSAAGGGHTRLRDFARATAGARPQPRGDGLRGRLAALFAWVRPLWRWAQPLLAPLGNRKPLAITAAGLLVVVTASVALALHQLPAGRPTVPGGAATAPASTGTAVGSPAATSAAAHPTATKTPAAPRLALTCAVTGGGTSATSATLTIKNTGTTSVSWQANASGQVKISQAQGQLSVGETATPTVTSRKRLSGTITVTASNGARSASFSVSCQ
jgi:hypothetical protein